MKLGKSVLLELVAIVQEGIAKGEDISQMLRELDLVEESNEASASLELSVAYVTAHPRATDWEECN